MTSPPHKGWLGPQGVGPAARRKCPIWRLRPLKTKGCSWPGISVWTGTMEGTQRWAVSQDHNLKEKGLYSAGQGQTGGRKVQKPRQESRSRGTERLSGGEGDRRKPQARKCTKTAPARVRVRKTLCGADSCPHFSPPPLHLCLPSCRCLPPSPVLSLALLHPSLFSPPPVLSFPLLPVARPTPVEVEEEGAGAQGRSPPSSMTWDSFLSAA